MARAILFTDDDLLIGGTGEVIGTSEGAEEVTVVFGQISLDASFNRGGDTVILPGISSDYFGQVVGSRFVITKGDYSLSIPLGVEGITIQFDNVSKTLIIDEESGTVLLANQDFTQIVEQIDPADQSTPLAVDDAAVLDASEASVLLGNVLDNDSDPQGDELVVSRVGGEIGNVGQELEGQFGTLIIEADGDYRYTADADALAELGEGESATDTFTYVVSDGNGGTDQADLVITVEGSNEPPETGTISVASSEDGPVRIVDGLANAHDPEGSTLTVIPPDELPDGVTFDEATGEFALDPSADAFQELAKGDTQTLQINYQVSDGTTTSAARIIWHISGRNDAADFDGDTRGTVREDLDATDSGQLTVTDVEAGQGAFDPASDGQSAGEYGTFNFDSHTGKWRYFLDDSNPAVQALDDDETLTDLLRVSSLDGSAQTIRITIQGMNDAPVARADSYTVDEDGTLNIPAAAGVLANDTDIDGEPLSAALVAGPAHGALTLNPDGSFSYTPDAGYSGTDSFIYSGNDGTAKGNVTTVMLTITAAEEPPISHVITGTNDDDNLIGTVGDDTIQGLDGNDQIEGRAGDDRLEGGAGDDYLNGGLGTDTLLGGDGADSLNDEAGTADVLRGEGGNDNLYAYRSKGGGSLTLDGGADDDSISFYGSSRETDLTVLGGSGANSIYVEGFDEGAIGSGDSNDFAQVSDANIATIDLGAGENTFSIQSVGTVDINAGDGNDFAQVLYTDIATIDLGAGENTILAYSVGTAVITGGGASDNIGVGQNTSTTIDAGAGEDHVSLDLYGSGSSYNVTLGSGQDEVILTNYVPGEAAAVVVEDFEAGDAGDALNLTEMLVGLDGWDQSSNPFEGGFLRLVQDGDDTLLQVDADGAAGEDYSPETLLTLSNVQAEDLTAYNLGGTDR